jgi:hypothetical protein
MELRSIRVDGTKAYFACRRYAEKEAPIPLPVAVEDVLVRCTGAVEGKDDAAYEDEGVA